MAAADQATDDELFDELRDVASRIAELEALYTRRAKIWEELRVVRGFMLKPIADASGGVTEGAVTHGIKKLQAERSGTWDPKRTPSGKRRGRRTAK